MRNDPPGKVFAVPAGHDYDNFSALLKSGKHRIGKPNPVRFKKRGVVRFERGLYEVVDDEKRRAESGRRSGRGSRKVIVVAV